MYNCYLLIVHAATPHRTHIWFAHTRYDERMKGEIVDGAWREQNLPPVYRRLFNALSSVCDHLKVRYSHKAGLKIMPKSIGMCQLPDIFIVFWSEKHRLVRSHSNCGRCGGAHVSYPAGTSLYLWRIFFWRLLIVSLLLGFQICCTISGRIFQCSMQSLHPHVCQNCLHNSVQPFSPV